MGLIQGREEIKEIRYKKFRQHCWVSAFFKSDKVQLSQSKWILSVAFVVVLLYLCVMVSKNEGV